MFNYIAIATGVIMVGLMVHPVVTAMVAKFEQVGAALALPL